MALQSTIGGNGALFVGEDKTFKLELLTVDSIPVDMSGWTILFDVRRADKSADPAIISKMATIAGAYNAVRATNVQRATVILTDTEMNTVKADTYRYSWKRMDDGSETVLAWGDFTPQKATAP